MEVETNLPDFNWLVAQNDPDPEDPMTRIHPDKPGRKNQLKKLLG